MIVRQVKLTFQSLHVEDFLELFYSVEEKIKTFPGCQKLELLQDINNKNIFFTYSIWNSEADIELYRHSDLFESVWKKTKSFFLVPAEAWSLTIV